MTLSPEYYPYIGYGALGFFLIGCSLWACSCGMRRLEQYLDARRDREHEERRERVLQETGHRVYRPFIDEPTPPSNPEPAADHPPSYETTKPDGSNADGSQDGSTQNSTTLNMNDRGAVCDSTIVTDDRAQLI